MSGSKRVATKKKGTVAKKGSKTTRKINKCKHIYVKGAKKGKKCNVNCKNTFCKEHNKKRQEYREDYNNKLKKDRNKQKEDSQIEKIRSIKNIFDLPVPENLLSKVHNNDLEWQRHIKQMGGIKIFLGADVNMVINEIYDQIYGKCWCDSLIEKCEIKKGDKNTIMGCRRCQTPLYMGRIHYFEFKGKTEEEAKTKFNKLKLERDQIKMKIDRLKLILKNIYEQKKKLEEEGENKKPNKDNNDGFDIIEV